MAVVQISKIQIRRGKKNSGTGIPQLAGGELAWAVDTQELYIGNGAVGEGAPSVGNTKILTEKDSILELASIYKYKQNAIFPVLGTTFRSVQDRLDEGVVNARSFGILSTADLPPEDIDQTEKIQQAFNEIAGKTKVTLEFDPGEYQFSETITLPSNLRVSGFGKEQTIFKFTGTGVAFETVEDSVNQMLKDFSIVLTNNNSTCLSINDSKYLEADNLKFTFDNVTVAGVLSNQRIGIRLISSNSWISNNKFRNLEFKYLTYGVYANSAASFNTFDNCLFEYLYQGIILGFGSSIGASYNLIANSTFDKITRQGLYIYNGTGNTSKCNIYKDVGATNQGTSSSYSIIRFDVEGNNTTDDIFERSDYLEENNPLFNNNPYYPEVEGIGFNQRRKPKRTSLPESVTTRMAFRLPIGNATSIKVDYIYRSTTFNQVRKGTLNLSIDKTNDRVQLVDDYEFVGANPNGDSALIFTASLETIASATTVRVNYTNTNTSDVNTFTYTYSILS